MNDTKVFQVIPGVGKSISQDLLDLGFTNLDELATADQNQMYQDLSALRGIRMDPCVLYVFRCAIYFASHDEHDPKLLKWWNWKDMENNM